MHEMASAVKSRRPPESTTDRGLDDGLDRGDQRPGPSNDSSSQQQRCRNPRVVATTRDSARPNDGLETEDGRHDHRTRTEGNENDERSHPCYSLDRWPRWRPPQGEGVDQHRTHDSKTDDEQQGHQHGQPSRAKDLKSTLSGFNKSVGRASTPPPMPAATKPAITERFGSHRRNTKYPSPPRRPIPAPSNTKKIVPPPVITPTTSPASVSRRCAAASSEVAPMIRMRRRPPNPATSNPASIPPAVAAAAPRTVSPSRRPRPSPSAALAAGRSACRSPTANSPATSTPPRLITVTTTAVMHGSLAHDHNTSSRSETTSRVQVPTRAPTAASKG